MSFDTSRYSFHPWNDYFGVVMQQGRVQLDADWNEWVAELGRRLHAGTMDTVGRAVVPRTTPEGFHILAAGGVLSIGIGRMYVDGLLAENHGKPPLAWDAGLAELSGSAPTPFLDQPYLPFNEINQPAPANIFNRPALSGGPHLVYIDVWERELTSLQAPDLVEKAVGVDTTGRLQTVWQVKLLHNIGDAGCFTPDTELPAWAALIRPSGARLSNSTGTVTGEPNPCLAPPSAGYKGLENQLYRVEIHRGGPQASATFKWSRDNATVATGVLEIQGGTRLVVDSLGRDDVLGFHGGEWVEILDDWHELHGLPGRLHRIRPGNDGIDGATRSIILETALPAGLFPVDGQGKTDPYRHTRVRRWDQSGMVRRADGSDYHNLDAATVSDGIPVPAAGTKLALENGILVDFSLVAGGVFHAGDHWVFAARTSDGSIEPLNQAPPRGIHHHYARLAIVTLPDEAHSCRKLWPPEVSGESCDCTICVRAEAHNAGTATIQQAIDLVREQGGGAICLDVGTYLLRAPLDMTDVRSLRMRGQGWRTVLQPTTAGGAIEVRRGIGVTVENLSVVGMVGGEVTTAMIDIAQSVDVHLSRLTVAAVAEKGAASAAIGLSGILIATTIRDCVLVGQLGVAAMSGKKKYLVTANLNLADNVFFCQHCGISLEGACLHYGQLRLADSLILGCSQAGISMKGGALPAARVIIDGNVLQVSGTGIAAGSNQVCVTGNEIVALDGRTAAPGIHLLPGFDKGALDHVLVTGNRLHGQSGHAIAIAHRLVRATFQNNTIEDTAGAALVMMPDAAADYLAIKDNRFVNIGVGFNDKALPFIGVQLLATRRVDVSGNLFANVARQALISPLRVAIMTLATREVNIAGNRLHGIGPTDSYNRRTVGIGIAPGFADAALDGNTVSRVNADTEKIGTAEWQAILVLGAVGEEKGTINMAVPGAVLFMTKSGSIYLTAAQIAWLSGSLGSAMVRGNRLTSTESLLPAAEIVAVEGCLFDQNDVRVIGGDREGWLAGCIKGVHASVANNRLAGTSEKAIFELFTDKEKFSVLGNLRTAPIMVNGTPDPSLPSPWNALNVTI
jgi:hypothetical protein